MNDFLCKKLVIRIEIFLKNLPSTKNWTGFYDDIVEASEKSANNDNTSRNLLYFVLFFDTQLRTLEWSAWSQKAVHKDFYLLRD